MAMHHRTLITLITFTLALCLVATAGDEAETVNGRYPGLLKGPLATATFGPLPHGVLVRYADKTLRKAALDKIIDNADPALQPQFRKNALLLAQELVTRDLLQAAARDAAARQGRETTDESPAALISRHLQDVASGVDVADKDLRAYYAAHPAQFEGKSFGDVRDTLEKFLRRKMRQDKVNAYVRNLGARYNTVLAKEWGLAKAAAMADNPIYRARRSGKPTMIMWSAATCKPCHKMKPHVQELKRQLAGKANIITVMADEQQLLAMRHGITATPTEIFYDAQGVERHRDNKYLSRKDILDAFREVGLR